MGFIRCGTCHIVRSHKFWTRYAFNGILASGVPDGPSKLCPSAEGRNKHVELQVELAPGLISPTTLGPLFDLLTLNGGYFVLCPIRTYTERSESRTELAPRYILV